MRSIFLSGCFQIDMIRIGSERTTIRRNFTDAESLQVLLVWKKLTKKFSDLSVQIASKYGKLSKEDPERDVLEKAVEEIIQAWASKIRRLGGEPRQLWTIAWLQEGQERSWQLEPDNYVLKGETFE